MNLNNVSIIGRLTADPTKKEIKTHQMAEFSIASDYGFGDNKHTSFFNCVAWGKTSESILKFCKKGMQVAICGKLRQERWESEQGKRSNVKIVVSSIQFFFENKDDKKESILDTDETIFSDGDIPF